MHCHASVYVPYKKLGGGDLIKGFEKMNQMPYAEARKLGHASGRLHRLPRPADDAAARHAARLHRGHPRAEGRRRACTDYDVNAMATRQEMRAFVCGQCHVEYYFKGPEKRLTYPVGQGAEGRRDPAPTTTRIGHKDWTHAETGAPVLKAQHPEFEMWNQGIHARSGVACADCHMPYKREGALKISDHHVRSPLLNINRACQTCHKWPEDELQRARRDDPGPHLRAAQPGDGRAGRR